ncbi:MAG: pilus assembly protein, partial [Stenotrophomonas sp.]
AITERTGSFSNVAANSTSVDGGTRIYQASYVSGVWTGEVQAYPITSDGKVSVTAAWSASAGIPATGRKVFSGNDTGTAAVAFPSGISEQRLAQLARTGVINYPVSGADNAAYLAGAQHLEMRNGGTLRNRNHLLGDIVSSSPAYVSDTETLYVGGNDGMLHALDATNGRELFAYIPSGISWSDLAGLSRPDYSHRFFVDGPVVVSTRVQTANKNILVGALGKGGKGLYALDVTSPSSFSASDFKWEVGGSSALMGLVQARPLITKLNNGKTAVVVANGINSASGRAALLIYDIDTGALIKSIDTGVGSSTVDSPAANGLTSVVGWDADGNGTVDAVYGGDMLGNIWKFDLGQGVTSGWGVHEDKPLFTATGPDGTVQPVTGGLTLALHPRTYQPWLFFGTGRLLTAGDMTSADVQSLYGMVDDGSAKLRSGAGANLTQRSIVEATTLAGFPVRAFERRQPLPAGSKGWYIDLLKPPVPGTAEGERAVSDAQLYGDVLIISTVIPTADACQADGRGYINAIDAYTGTSTGPSLFDLNGNGSFDDETIGDDDLPVGSVDLGVGMPTLAEILRGLAVVGGSSGNLGNVPIREARNVGRVSWREVLQN